MTTASRNYSLDLLIAATMDEFDEPVAHLEQPLTDDVKSSEPVFWGKKWHEGTQVSGTNIYIYISVHIYRERDR